MKLRGRLKYWLHGNCPGLAGSFAYCGTQVYFPKNSISFRAACEQGIFEADNVCLLQDLVKRNTTYFDVGANIGLMSVPILQGCSNCMVVSFEPSPNTLPYLQRTASESCFKNRWVIIPRALSDTQEQAEFHLASKELSMFDGLRDTQRVTIARTVTVEVSTLDAEWSRLGRPVVSVIKCDVEGNELAILRGARCLLKRDRPFVLMEWNRDNLRAYEYDPTEILTFGSSNGYRLFALPRIIEVSSALELTLQMTLTESFLLAPSQ